ncbi:MAG TPA: LuxR C-terminal-related transcriptional regulator [Kofleriaceae bacterium]
MNSDASRRRDSGRLWAGACPALVERDAQLELLQRVADRVAAGEGQCAVVTGEAGTGKSRLCREFVASLGDDWLRVAASASSGGASPFGALLDEVPAGDAPAGAIGSALGHALARRAGDAPLAVVIEDLERVDPVLIAALGSALDTVVASRVLIVAAFRITGTSRVDERAGAVAEVLRSARAHEVRLSSLSPSGVIQMAALMAQPIAGDAAAALHARADGNPFFVEELLNTPDGERSWTITEAIRRRLAAMPIGAQEIAEALACALDPLPRPLVEGIVDDGEAGVNALVDAGIAAVETTDDIALRHALLSEVIASELAPRERRQWHRRIAAALEQQPGTAAARLARHWRAAGDIERAARWAVVAADDATQLRAYRTATGLYQVALSAPVGDEHERAELLERAAVAAGLAGSDTQAREWAAGADTLYRRVGEQWRAVSMWLNPALHRLPKPSVDRSALDDDAIPRLLMDAHDATLHGDHELAAQLARRVLARADERTDLGMEWASAAARRLIAAGHLAEGDDILFRLRASATASQNWPMLTDVIGQQSVCAISRGEILDCLALNGEAVRIAHAHDLRAWTYQVGIALIDAYLGELDDADALVEELLARDDPVVDEFVQLPACIVDLQRGELPTARQRLERLQAVRTLQVPDYTVGVLAAQARLHHFSHEPEQVLAAVAETREVSGDLFEPCRFELLVLAARAGCALDDDSVIGGVRASLDELVELGGGRGYRAGSTWARGIVAHRRGARDEASALLTAAAEGFERAGRFVHAVESWLDVAETASAEGDSATQQRAVGRARELCESRGLVAALDRASNYSSHDEPLNPALRALSAREQEIARLVAAGNTNRAIAAALFVSEHTVRNQLVNIFAKLGVSRRTELARVVLGGAAPPAQPSGQRDVT